MLLKVCVSANVPTGLCMSSCSYIHVYHFCVCVAMDVDVHGCTQDVDVYGVRVVYGWRGFASSTPLFVPYSVWAWQRCTHTTVAHRLLLHTPQLSLSLARHLFSSPFVHAYVSTLTRTRTHTHTHTHTCTCTRAHKHTHACTHAHTQAHTHARTCARTHVHTHTRMHARVNTHTHTRTH